jgi:hypothetical protein
MSRHPFRLVGVWPRRPVGVRVTPSRMGAGRRWPLVPTGTAATSAAYTRIAAISATVVVDL